MIFWSHEVESAIPIAYSAWWNHQEDVGSIPTGDELSNFYNQKLIIHPQWESNPRPPGVFTRHYKLWEWHFQLHDFRKSLHPHWHFMPQHFQIKYIYQLCIANVPILIAKGFFLKQLNFYNQKLIAHPQWESNPRPPGDFTRHYKLWEWHFQLHDFRKSLHPHWHFMCQHFQIKYIYQCVLQMYQFW